MKSVSYILIIVLLLAIGCEKKGETREILFCTNSGIGNCAFSIEISVDGNKIGTLTAGSEYSSLNCVCPDSAFIGMIVDIESGEHTYTAKELNCTATNRINMWAGIINVSNNDCETVILDIRK